MTDLHARFQLSFADFSLDVDIRLPYRGVTAIFGDSGSGKTTLLRCLAGLERSPIGQLIVAGEIWQAHNYWKPVYQRPLGYVFQEASLLSHLTVMENLNYGKKRVSVGERISLGQAIELLGIEHLLNRHPERLSGGEKSRVAIARALALSPSILLMDEPLAALDMKRKQEILPYLERLHDELDIPILYVTHSPEEVARLADHLVVMQHGRVIANGVLAEILPRFDLAMSFGDNTGVVLEGTIVEIDHKWHLAKVAFANQALWVPDSGLHAGQTLRVRILAKDVSLSDVRAADSTIQNVMQGHIDDIADDDHPGLAVVRVKVGTSIILAKLTKRALHQQNVSIGQLVWLQVKAAALLR